VMSGINQMVAQKPRLKLVRAQHFTHEKIIKLENWHSAPWNLATMAPMMVWYAFNRRDSGTNLFPTARRTLDMRSPSHVASHRDAHTAEKSWQR
jgi:hypothetical protein